MCMKFFQFANYNYLCVDSYISPQEFTWRHTPSAPSRRTKRNLPSKKTSENLLSFHKRISFSMIRRLHSHTSTAHLALNHLSKPRLLCNLHSHSFCLSFLLVLLSLPISPQQNSQDRKLRKIKPPIKETDCR